MEYGTLKSSSVGENKDGRRNVRLLEVEIRPGDDVTVELDASISEDYVPRIGSRVYFEAVTSTYNVSTRIVDPDNLVDPSLGEGDRLSHALDESGGRVATILQEADGSITLNEGTERAVLGDTLIDIYNQLQVPTAFGLSGVPVRPLTVADMSEKVKLK